MIVAEEDHLEDRGGQPLDGPARTRIGPCKIPDGVLAADSREELKIRGNLQIEEPNEGARMRQRWRGPAARSSTDFAMSIPGVINSS